MFLLFENVGIRILIFKNLIQNDELIKYLNESLLLEITKLDAWKVSDISLEISCYSFWDV